MKPTRKLAQLLECELQVRADGLEHALRSRRVVAQALLGHPQPDGEGDEALLGPVMKVALESPSLCDACLDDAGT